MARRLIEAGAKFVTVTDRGWDTHESLDLRLREGYTGGHAGKIPKLDTAYAGLLEDLSERGLLDSTLVILMGEFGRTPKLNPRGGRDHWPRAFSVVLSGGGIRGGQVVGKSDRHGERPADRAVTPADLARTIYQDVGHPRRSRAAHLRWQAGADQSGRRAGQRVAGVGLWSSADRTSAAGR